MQRKQQPATDEMSPLEVMLSCMRRWWAEDALDKAAAMAKDLAPYMHPRLSSVSHDGLGTSLSKLSEGALDARIRQLMAEVGVEADADADDDKAAP